MKFDDIVHFTGDRSVCPPATNPVPLRFVGHCQKSRPRPPATNASRYYCGNAVPWVSLYLPARSVEGHLISGTGVHMREISRLLRVLLISPSVFVCTSRTVSPSILNAAYLHILNFYVIIRDIISRNLS